MTLTLNLLLFELPFLPEFLSEPILLLLKQTQVISAVEMFTFLLEKSQTQQIRIFACMNSSISRS